MSGLKEVARECHEAVLANGFEVPTWENFPVKVMLAVTELNEAVAASDEANWREEWADFVIRVTGVLEALSGGEWLDRSGTFRYYYERVWTDYISPLECHVWPALEECCKSVEYWRMGKRVDALMRLEFAVAQAFRIEDMFEFDLVAEMRAKNEVNKSRGRLHGKKESVG